MSAQRIVRKSIAVVAIVIPALAWTDARQAQVGYLRARAHLSGDQPASRFPSHSYFASGDSLVDRPDGAYPPGSYTIARLEVSVAGCTAVATNISFTITAEQLTEIDPLVTLPSCRLRVAPASDFGGVGRVQVIPSASAQPGLNRTLSKSNGIVVSGSPSACSLTLPYGEAFTLKLTLGDDKTHLTDIQYQPCTLESDEKTYDCSYVADTNYT